MARIEFIYFDLGNVLISFDHSRAFQQIADLTGITPARAERFIFHSGLQERYERGEVSTADFHQFFCEQAQVDISIKDLCFAASNVFEPLSDSIQLSQDLADAGHRLGVLSNTCDCHWNFCLGDDRFKFLRSNFEATVLSYIVGAAKPEPLIYRTATDQANCSPESILFIDDIQDNVDAARSYGFDTIHFQNFSALHNALTKRKLI
jgi:FMN phosphatase YigB (HAD superfamily)